MEGLLRTLKADFGLDSINMPQFWATEATLSMAMLAYSLMNLFCQTVMKSDIHHMLATLHHKVFAVGAFWDSNAEKNILRLAVARRRRKWFEGFGHKPQSILGCIGLGMNKGLTSNGQSELKAKSMERLLLF